MTLKISSATGTI